MNMCEAPLVSVLTPVYNGEAYLAECIESVLAQTYSNWEYTIVNNSSTDGTLSIAQRYAKTDKRIRIYENERLLDIIASHNRAFRLVSSESKYCKIVSADDWLFPECIERMVSVAEANPSVGIVGSYQLSGGGTDRETWRVKWTELAYPSTVMSGREICRSHLLGGPYVFGTPTSCLYRADLVKGQESFYPNSTAEADTSACFKYLQSTDFGFVHQVLSYERIHEASMSAECRRLNTYFSSRMRDLLEYGPSYLTKDEIDRCLEKLLAEYYQYLATSVFHKREQSFWNYHKKRFSECGYPFSHIRFVQALGMKVMDLLLNPLQTFEKFLLPRSADFKRIKM